MNIYKDMFDFAIVGAGIAGASVAAELAGRARVLLIEREAQPGYHTTGRSAAMFAPGYGPAPIRALTRASAGFFAAPPEGFAQTPLITPRDVVMLARANQMEALAALERELAGEAEVVRLGAGDLSRLLPLLRPGYARAGLLDRSGSEIDVHALLQGYLGAFRARGGVLAANSELGALTRESGIWHLKTRAGPFRARHVINAAGAWADEVAAMAGAERIGLTPKRRSALIVDAPDGLNVSALPLAVDIDEAFYMKPDAGRLLISPANADPMPPCDVQPEELDIALCIDRIERAFTLKVTRIVNRWAGLRSFVADKCPVVGPSDTSPGFFWLAGQGGYGIQSAPALARLAAAMALNEALPEDILAQGLAPRDLAPGRLLPAP